MDDTRGLIASRIIVSRQIVTSYLRSIARFHRTLSQILYDYPRALKSSRRGLMKQFIDVRTSERASDTMCLAPAFSSSSSSSSTALGRPPLTFGRYKFVSLHHPLRIPFLQWVNCTLTLRAASDVSRGYDRYPSAELSIDPRPPAARLLFSAGTHDPPRGRKQ